MFNIDWARILFYLRDIKPFRFYFIITLSFLLILGNIYKDPISVAVKEITFSPVEFRECRDLKGLEVALNDINTKNNFIDSYTVYLYQPKSKPYYKKMILTNSDIVKRITSLQGSYLQDQPTFNTLLLTNDFFILETGGAATPQDTRFMKDLGVDYLFVYKLYKKETLGEIVFILNRKPTPMELDSLIKEVSPLIHEYIL